MAITVVQSATATPFTAAVTIGNTLFVIGYVWSSGNPLSTSNPTQGGVTPGNATVVQSILSPETAGNYALGAIWMLPAVAGTSSVFGLSQSGGAFNAVQAYEVSGLGANPTVDQSAQNSSGGLTAVTVTSAQITQASEFVLGAASIYSGCNFAPSGWSAIHANNESWAAYQIASSSGGTYSWAQTTVAEPWTAGIVTLYAGAAATSDTPATSPVAAFAAAGVI